MDLFMDLFKPIKKLYEYGKYLFEFCDWVTDYFGFSDNIRILIKIGSVAVILLLVVIFWKVIKKFFHRKEEFRIEKETGIDNSILQSKIRNEHEIQVLTTDYEGKVRKEEKGSGWFFDYLNKLMNGREYVANYVASIRGFVDLSSAETDTKEKPLIEVEHIKGFNRVVVTVSVPAGYFSTDIDVNDFTTEKHDAGVFISKFSDDEKKKFLREQYYEKVTKMIEDANLIKIAKENTRKLIKQTLGGILEGLGYTENKLVDKILKEQNLKLKDLTEAKMEELKIFKTYKVGVKFISTSWKVYRSNKHELLGELMDPDVTK